MELPTTGGWNTVNDIESMIVPIQYLLVVENYRLEVATHLESDEVQVNATCKKKSDVAAALALPCSFINRFSPPGCFGSCMTPLSSKSQVKKRISEKYLPAKLDPIPPRKPAPPTHAYRTTTSAMDGIPLDCGPA
jgi:hypothetical protein